MSEHIRQKKSLGQVFLKAEWPLRKTVETLKDWGVTRVLEIGPGGGVLTRALLDGGLRVTAVEKDNRFAEQLNITALLSEGRLTVINRDILKFDLAAWLAESQEKTAVVGNIPYYISSPITLWVLPHLERLAGVFFLVQLEFAERLAARPGTKDYGSLSVFTQLRAQVEFAGKVDRTAFKPVPKVHSALVALRQHPAPLDPKTLDQTEKVTRKAFQMRRKKLRNAVGDFLTPEGEADCPIDLNRRPDVLTPEEYVLLARHLLAP